MALGYVNARIILTIAFFLVLTPICAGLAADRPRSAGAATQHWPGWSPYPARYRDQDHFTRMY